MVTILAFSGLWLWLYDS